MKMNVQVGGTTFTATLEQNAAVDALVDMLRDAPIKLQMSDYAGFEKVASLEADLPTSNSQTTTQAGDIDLTGWEDALGSGDVTVTLPVATADVSSRTTCRRSILFWKQRI